MISGQLHFSGLENKLKMEGYFVMTVFSHHATLWGYQLNGGSNHFILLLLEPKLFPTEMTHLV